MTALTVAVDAMGGDAGLPVTVAAAIAALEHADLRLVLVGDQSRIEAALLDAMPSGTARIAIEHAPLQIAMDASPAVALRRSERTSMLRMLELIRDGRADSGVSAGNTGALMALGKSALGMIRGVGRPALVAYLPNRYQRVTYLLDVGANLSCSAQRLHEFAMMGCALHADVEGSECPRVGILNVGTEANKGPRLLRQAAALVQGAAQQSMVPNRFEYVGFVEASQLFDGDVDVVVTDGFAGNVALKASEAAARMARHVLASTLQSAARATAIAPWIGRWSTMLDPGQYNGASLLGLRGVVVKSHGGSNPGGFAWAIRRAMTEAARGAPRFVEARLAGANQAH